MKVRYFFKLDRDRSRPLVLWGAGRNGKDLAKLLLDEENTFHWVCDNERKIGRDIYQITMQHFEEIEALNSPQILIAITSPEEKEVVKKQLKSWNKKPVEDYWFFL